MSGTRTRLPHRTDTEHEASLRPEETRRSLFSRRLDTPAFPAALAALGGVAFVLLRLFVVAKGDLSRFVLAGSHFVDRAKAPRGLHVFPSGYDGQFYYRLALDPLDLARTAFGITLDSPFRVQRIGLSAISWLASGGQHPLVVDAEVAVNLAALVSLAALGGVIAKDAGRHAGWGLLVAGYWGFLFSIGRDLPEVVASVFLIGAMVALRRERGVLSGLLFAGAVLTIETTLDAVLAIGLCSVAAIVLRRRRPSRRDAAWLVPGAAFIGWQLYCLSAVGVLPMRSDSGDNLALPVVDPVHAVGHYVALVPSLTALNWFGELFVLVVVVAVAAWLLRGSRAELWVKVAWGISVLVALSLSIGIWEGTADFRAFEDLYLFSVVVALGSRRRLWILAGLVVVAWLVTFAHRVVNL